jgi:hypothetical protein
MVHFQSEYSNGTLSIHRFGAAFISAHPIERVIIQSRSLVKEAPRLGSRCPCTDACPRNALVVGQMHWVYLQLPCLFPGRLEHFVMARFLRLQKIVQSVDSPWTGYSFCAIGDLVPLLPLFFSFVFRISCSTSNPGGGDTLFPSLWQRLK